MRRIITFCLLFAVVAGMLGSCRGGHRPDVHRADHPIPNFRWINERLCAGAWPGEEGVQWLARAGVKAVVNLESETVGEERREAAREKEWAGGYGVKFFRIPMHALFAPKKREVEKALSLITDPDNQPVFVHCHEGRDRTGVVIAAYRITVDGWSRKRAYEEMKKYGFHRVLFWWKGSIPETPRRGRMRGARAHPVPGNLVTLGCTA